MRKVMLYLIIVGVIIGLTGGGTAVAQISSSGGPYAYGGGGGFPTQYGTGGIGAGTVIGGGAGACLAGMLSKEVRGSAAFGIGCAAFGGAALGYLFFDRPAAAAAEKAAAEKAAAPKENCSWVYDHSGAYAWRCAGQVQRAYPGGPPQSDLPPPQKARPSPSPAEPAILAAFGDL